LLPPIAGARVPNDEAAAQAHEFTLQVGDAAPDELDAAILAPRQVIEDLGIEDERTVDTTGCAQGSGE